MTDNTTSTAAVTLALPDAQPVPVVPQMSVAEATSKKSEFFADKAKMDALMAGDVNATAEWRNIVNAISAQPNIPTGQHEDLVEHINAASGYSLSDGALDQVRNNTPITPEERRMTLALWEEKKQDPEWIARLNRGEVRARREMAAININLASPVREPQSQ